LAPQKHTPPFRVQIFPVVGASRTVTDAVGVQMFDDSGVAVKSELSMGPFRVTQPNPTHY